MGQINWDEFKQYKQVCQGPQEQDNFQILLNFIKSYYNKSSVFDIFDILAGDELAQMMLQKRNIREPEDLEVFLYKTLRV